MIPKIAIEKAIEGGWKPEYRGAKIVKAYKSIDFFAERDGHGSRIDVRHTALTPAFWQALGKALGWSEAEARIADCQLCYGAEWHRKAHRFYDLILTKQDTTAFWNELLANK